MTTSTSTPTSTPKRIVITGVSRGLGLAMAAGFIQAGHTVIGCSRSADAIAKLRQKWPEPQQFFPVDVTDDASVRHWASRVLPGGPPDLLLNNAAQINRNARVWEVPADEFESIMRVNVLGVVNVLRHFVPSMVEAGRGVIVNFSSGWGRSASAKVGPYVATKWAIEGLTRALASELPRGMAAVPLNPGVINTDMLQSCWGGGAASYPLPAEWARRAVPFLLTLGPDDNGEPATVPEADEWV